MQTKNNVKRLKKSGLRKPEVVVSGETNLFVDFQSPKL
jgi:hypothetical protein